MSLKDQLIQGIFNNITNKTEPDSISPVILGDILENIVEFSDTKKDPLTVSSSTYTLDLNGLDRLITFENEVTIIIPNDISTEDVIKKSFFNFKKPSVINYPINGDIVTLNVDSGSLVYIERIGINDEWVVKRIDDGSTLSILEQLIPEGLISGGVVSWSGTGFVYNISQAIIKLNGEIHTIPSGQITLDPSDPTNPRVDVIYVDIDGFGFITGTPAVDPIIPQVNIATQIFLTSIIIASNTTEPGGVSNNNIYLENSEWPGTFTGTGTVNFESTSNPRTGTYAIEFTNIVSGSRITMTADANFDLNDIDLTSFWLRLKSNFVGQQNLQVYFRDENDIQLTSATNISFNKSLVGEYQFVAVNINSLNNLGNGTIARKIEFRYTTNNFTPKDGFFIDDWKLQGGISQPVPTTEFKVQDENGVTQFTTENFLKLSGANFDPINKTISFPESLFIKVNSGFGEGIRYRDYDTLKFRAIGLGALDLTKINVASADNNYGTRANYGLSIGLNHKIGTGDHHLSLGTGNVVTGTWNNMAIGAGNIVGGFVSNFVLGTSNTITQGYGSGAIGSYNTVNHNVNGFGVAIGHNNVLSDIGSNAFGMALISKSRNTVAVGVANTDYAETGNEATRPIFVVGTGTTTTPTGAWQANLRRDGFIVRHNGLVEAPDLTTAKIDAGVARTLVTKEWVTANAGGTPTLQEVLTEGNYTDTPLIVGLNSSSGGFDWKMRYERDGITFREQGIEGSKATTLVFPEMAGIPGTFENWQALLNLPELGNGEEETIATREWVTANVGVSTASGTVINLSSAVGSTKETPEWNSSYTLGSTMVRGGNETRVIQVPASGETDFPPVNGSVIQEGSAFELSGKYEMHVYTLDGTTVRHFFLKIS